MGIRYNWDLIYIYFNIKYENIMVSTYYFFFEINYVTYGHFFTFHLNMLFVIHIVRFNALSFQGCYVSFKASKWNITNSLTRNDGYDQHLLAINCWNSPLVLVLCLNLGMNNYVSCTYVGVEYTEYALNTNVVVLKNTRIVVGFIGVDPVFHLVPTSVQHLAENRTLLIYLWLIWS